MSDSTQQYILKQPVTRRADTINENYHAVTGLRFPQQRTFWVSKADWDKLFVPLDRQALQIAIREEIREYAESMLPDYGVPIHKTERLDSAVNAVLVLFGLENKDNK